MTPLPAGPLRPAGGQAWTVIEWAGADLVTQALGRLNADPGLIPSMTIVVAMQHESVSEVDAGNGTCTAKWLQARMAVTLAEVSAAAPEVDGVH